MDVEDMLRDALGCRVQRTTSRMKIQPRDLPTAGSQVCRSIDLICVCPKHVEHAVLISGCVFTGNSA